MSADPTQQTINLLNTGFTLCLVLALVGLAVSALLFWRFGVWQIIRERSGWAAQQARFDFLDGSTTKAKINPQNKAVLEVPSTPLLGKNADVAVSGETGRQAASGKSERQTPSAKNERQAKSGKTGRQLVLPSERAKQQNPVAFNSSTAADSFASEAEDGETTVLATSAVAGAEEGETTLLGANVALVAEDGETTVLGASADAVADAAGGAEEGETTVLGASADTGAEEGETTVLATSAVVGAEASSKTTLPLPRQLADGFVLVKEVILTNTDAGIGE